MTGDVDDSDLPWGAQLRRWRAEVKLWSQQELVDQVVRLAFETKEDRGTRLDVRLVGKWESGSVGCPQSVYRRLLSGLGAPIPAGLTASAQSPMMKDQEQVDADRISVAEANSTLSTAALRTPEYADANYLALLPMGIDGHPVLLPLDANVLVDHRDGRTPPAQDADGWPSTDDTLHWAGALDRTLRMVAKLSGADLKRRDFLLNAAFSAAAFAQPALFAMTAPPVADTARDAGSRRIGTTDVEILTDNIAHLRRMDFRYGSGRIRERAVQLLHHEATTLLHGSYSDATGRALLTAVAQAARLAASMATDVGRHALAQRYYIQALNLAMNVGNRLFAANVLSDMSRLTINNATGQRCARQAVALARAGTTVAGSATPTLAAQLSAVEARGHALCQDASATRTAVLDAQRHYERFRPDGEPAWLGFYTEAELAADLGRALRDSDEPEHAASLMSSTLDSYESWRVRSRCVVQTDLAATYLILRRAHDDEDITT